jgi:hypothetical protein
VGGRHSDDVHLVGYQPVLKVNLAVEGNAARAAFQLEAAPLVHEGLRDLYGWCAVHAGKNWEMWLPSASFAVFAGATFAAGRAVGMLSEGS